MKKLLSLVSVLAVLAVSSFVFASEETTKETVKETTTTDSKM